MVSYVFSLVANWGYHYLLLFQSLYSLHIMIIIIPLFTLSSIDSTYVSGAEQMTETSNSNQT